MRKNFRRGVSRFLHLTVSQLFSTSGLHSLKGVYGSEAEELAVSITSPLYPEHPT